MRTILALGVLLCCAWLAASCATENQAVKPRDEASDTASETTSEGDSVTATATVTATESATASESETLSENETDFGTAPENIADEVEVGVRNNCPFPLWIHAAGSTSVLEPDDAKLEPGEVRWYGAPESWPAARITAYSQGPRAGELEKVEATFVSQVGGPVLNYNVTYVDWVGLPVEVEGKGDGADCQKAGCDVPVAQLLDGCPSELRETDRCQSARSHCLNTANQSSAYCHALDGEVARCATTKVGCEGAASATTAEVYACSGTFFSASPKWCAAINRSMLDDPENPNNALYYQTEPHNTYAKWVHQRCPGLYAFPYDDYPSNAQESGFHACTAGKELHVTFCPGG